MGNGSANKILCYLHRHTKPHDEHFSTTQQRRQQKATTCNARAPTSSRKSLPQAKQTHAHAPTLARDKICARNYHGLILKKKASSEGCVWSTEGRKPAQSCGQVPERHICLMASTLRSAPLKNSHDIQ